MKNQKIKISMLPILDSVVNCLYVDKDYNIIINNNIEIQFRKNPQLVCYFTSNTKKLPKWKGWIMDNIYKIIHQWYNDIPQNYRITFLISEGNKFIKLKIILF